MEGPGWDLAELSILTILDHFSIEKFNFGHHFVCLGHAKNAFWVILPILGSGPIWGLRMLRLGPLRAAFGLEDLFVASQTHARSSNFGYFDHFSY